MLKMNDFLFFRRIHLDLYSTEMKKKYKSKDDSSTICFYPHPCSLSFFFTGYFCFLSLFLSFNFEVIIQLIVTLFFLLPKDDLLNFNNNNNNIQMYQNIHYLQILKIQQQYIIKKHGKYIFNNFRNLFYLIRFTTTPLSLPYFQPIHKLFFSNLLIKLTPSFSLVVIHPPLYPTSLLRLFFFFSSSLLLLLLLSDDVFCPFFFR